MRFRQFIHESAKFGTIGVIGLGITNIGYALLHSHGVGPVTSTTVATIAATIAAYIGNRYWSFRHRERTSVPREGTIFFALNGIGLLIQDTVVAFNSYVLHLEHHKLAEFVALNTGIGIATIFRFWSYRRFVWAAPAPAPAGAAAAAAGAVTVPEDAIPSGQPSANGQAAGQPGAGRPSPAGNGVSHVNGHTPAGQAPRKDSFSQG